MISTKNLLYGVIALVSLDVIITLVAVAGMGATELNPLSEMFGFYGFIALKIAVHVGALYVIYKYCLPAAPLSTRYGVGGVLGVYGIVCASNVYQIVWVVI